MAKGFTLEVNPWVYLAQYSEENRWEEKYIEKPHLTLEQESKLPSEEKNRLLLKRNQFEELALVNYTSQYGFGVFEGLKAYPHKDGALKIFRPNENAKRMARSMEGLQMPAFPTQMFVRAVVNVVEKNRKLGFTPSYNSAWEKEDFVTGHSVYVRPFTYSEPGIGLNLSHNPWVVVISTNVGAYFAPGNSKAVVTDKLRAYPGGTGWIKCNANYVTPTLIKYDAMAKGYMEAIFLDSEQKHFEEGSSCNIFFLLKNDTLVTPELGDTILPGVTRKSVLQLAADEGVKTEERKISVEEAFSEAKEVFVTGTAAGISYIESITHKDRTVIFCDGKIGELTHELLKTLKGIQYGALEDRFGWLVDCESEIHAG
jgi:branched-chain amino acid aminotransferase